MRIVPLQSIYINDFGSGLWTNRNPLLNVIDGAVHVDALIDGQNVEVSNARTIVRRPGHDKFSTVQLGATEVARKFHSFRNLGGTIRIMVDTGEKVAQFAAASRTDVHTLTDTDFQVSFLDIGDMLYFSTANSVAGDQQKWDGTTKSKWGIDGPADAPTFTLDASSAFTIDTPGNSGAVRASNVVTITTTAAHDFVVGQFVVIDGVTDSSFDGTFRVESAPTATTFTYDQTAGDATSGNGTATSRVFSIEVGVRYRFVFKNDATGHISNASDASADTGAFASKVVTLTGERSTDTQVDLIEVYRTVDNGADYFLVDEIANPPSGSWTFKDSTDDDDLGTLKAPIVLENSIPPIGLDNLSYHSGRMWGSVGNILYYSGGGEILNGVPEESWPPLQFFTFPAKVTATQSWAQGLLVFTEIEAWLVRGTDPASFWTQVLDPHLGIEDNNKIAADGDVAYLYTSDGQIVRLSAQGIAEIGFTISDRIVDLTNVYLAIHRDSSEDSGLYVSHSDASDAVIVKYNLSTLSWTPDFVLAGTAGNRAIASVQTSANKFDLLVAQRDANGFILKKDRSLFQDDGTSYPADFVLGSVVLSAPGTLTELASIIVERVDAGTAPTVSVLPQNFGHGDFSATFTAFASPVSEPPQFAAASNQKAQRFYLAELDGVSSLMRHLQLEIAFPTEAAKNEIIGIAFLGGEEPNA